MIRTFARGLAAAAILALTVSNANASIVIDLTEPGSSNAAGDNTASLGGTFLVQQTSGQPPAGQVIDTFVKLESNNAVSQGYNTDARPVQFNEDPSPTVTHSLSLSSVPTVTLTVNGVTEAYRQFVLQFQQPSPGLLSLNQIQLFLSSSPNNTDGFLFPATSTSPPALAFVNPNTFEVFRLNTPDTTFLEIQLKDSKKGIGQMFLYVRDAVFQDAIAANPNASLSNVYLYSQFGTPPGTFANSNGTQEWGVLKSSPLPVPEPSTIALALSGLGVLGLAGLRRRGVTMPDHA